MSVLNVPLNGVVLFVNLEMLCLHFLYAYIFYRLPCLELIAYECCLSLGTKVLQPSMSAPKIPEVHFQVVPSKYKLTVEY